MINCKELRIGNWLQQYGIYFQVEAISNFDGFCIGEPIPLTPDILERCGFEKSETDMIDSEESFSIQIGNTCSLYFTEGNWYISLEWVNHTHGHFFWAQPKYLHLLQNLFFALTDTELEINL